MAKNKKKKKKQHRFFWFMIKLQIFLMLIVIGGFGYYYFGGYAKQVQALQKEAIELVDASDEDTFVPSRTTSVFDANDNLISELSGDKDAEYVDYEDIPAEFVTAMVSIEDKKFYSHNGIDYKAIMRAVKAIIQSRRLSQGGSTITMQLARNIYLDMGKNWQRKVKEMFIALRLERKYSKNKIMEFYLNNVYFANGYYGVDAACHGYFNCELKDLSLSQIAFLCAIPNSPTYYDPIDNIEHTLKRRDRILDNMYEDQKISADVYKAAKNEEIVLNIPENKKTLRNNSVDTYTYYCATRALMKNEGFVFRNSFDSEEDEKAYDEEYDELYAYCQKKLYTDGYKIYTSIDMSKQKELQTSVDETLKEYTKKGKDGVYTMQGAAVCIDNDSGYVVAIVGGRKQKFSSYTLNRAYQSHRQPGSSIKPLIVYTPSFENGETPDSKVKDYKFEGGPSNSGNSYYGDVEIRFAVAKSLNTVAWQLYDKLTPKVGLSYLKNMNFSNIVDSDYVTATSLGGFTTGVSPVEMASAYATLENDGKYREPTCIVSIIDSDENIIYASEQEEKPIYTQTASRMMVECMEGVMDYGTGRGVKLAGMPCAGKTGTTNEQKDGWFCGFTRYYTTCVWVGYDIPKAVPGLTGSSYPGSIWKRFMSSIHEGLTPIDFLPYAQISDKFQEEKESESEEDIEDEEIDEDLPEDDIDESDSKKDTGDEDTPPVDDGNVPEPEGGDDITPDNFPAPDGDEEQDGGGAAEDPGNGNEGAEVTDPSNGVDEGL